MKRTLCFIMIFSFLLITSARAEPLRDGDIEIKAPSALLMEKSTGEVLYEKNADERRLPPASPRL